MPLEEDLISLFFEIFWKLILGKLGGFTKSPQKPGFLYFILKFLTTLFAALDLFAL